MGWTNPWTPWPGQIEMDIWWRQEIQQRNKWAAVDWPMHCMTSFNALIFFPHFYKDVKNIRIVVQQQQNTIFKTGLNRIAATAIDAKPEKFI